MTWRLHSRLAARRYSDEAERTAFAAGYKDAYREEQRGASARFAIAWPNAYNAGYWEGFADRREPEE